MRYRVERIDRTFSSADAERLSGVANTVQRDWRRRGLLPERTDRKRIRFSLLDVCELKVMGFLSASNISPGLVKALGRHAALSVYSRLVRLQRVAATEPFEFTTEEFRLGCEAIDEGEMSRFAFLPLPERHQGDSVSDCYFEDSLDAAHAKASADGAFSGALILDAWALADEIANSAEEPLFRLIAEEAPE